MQVLSDIYKISLLYILPIKKGRCQLVFASYLPVCADDIQFYLFRKCQGRTAAIVPPKKRVIAVPSAKVAVVKFIENPP
jgi:hypothetical protein